MVSLCMIVRDEEETLDKCLRNINGLVDEIVIVDTGSKDKSKEISYKYTDKVFDFKWCDDFAEARNFSINKANNEWILVLDADEIVINYNKESIKKFCENSIRDVGRINVINYFEDIYGTKKNLEKVTRLFNKNHFVYEGSIHEQLVNKYGDEYKIKNLELTVEHSGYLKDVLEKKNKIDRNVKLLKKEIKKNRDDSYLYYQLGKSYFIAKNYKDSYKYFKKALEILKKDEFEYVEDLVECYGYSMINLQLFNEALDLYKYKNYYNSPDYIFLMGLIEMNVGNFNKSINNFLTCTKYENGKVEGITSFLPIYNIGVIYECLGFKKEALSYFKMCEQYTPALNRIESILSGE